MNIISDYCASIIWKYCQICYKNYYPIRTVNKHLAQIFESKFRNELILNRKKIISMIVFQGYQLSDSFILKYWEELDSYYICKYQKMRLNTIIYIWKNIENTPIYRSNNNYTLKDILCFYQKIPFELISEYLEKKIINQSSELNKQHCNIGSWLGTFFIHKKGVSIPNWFLKQHEQYILDFNKIRYLQENETFILKHHKQINEWSRICHDVELPSWFLAMKKEYLKPIDYFLARGVDLSFIRRHANLEDWIELVKYRKINLQDFNRYLEPEKQASDFWQNLSIHSQNLDSYVIHQHADKFNWDFLCKNSVLPCWLLQMHIDKLNWDVLVECQKLSKKFIDQNITHFSILSLLHRQQISESTLARIIHYDSIDYSVEISTYQKLSLEFVKIYQRVLKVDIIFNRSDISLDIKKYIHQFLDTNIYKLPNTVY